MGLAMVQPDSPLAKLRDWRPSPAKYVWVVFYDAYRMTDKPEAAFPTEFDAQMFCVDQIVDRNDTGEPMSFEEAAEMWHEQYSIVKVPYYP